MEVPVLLPKESAVLCEEYVEDKKQNAINGLKPQNTVRDELPDVKQTYQTPFTYLCVPI